VRNPCVVLAHLGRSGLLQVVKVRDPIRGRAELWYLTDAQLQALEA